MNKAKATFMLNPDGQFPGSFTLCFPKGFDTDKEEAAFRDYFQVGKEVNFKQEDGNHSGIVLKVEENDRYIFVTVRM